MKGGHSFDSMAASTMTTQLTTRLMVALLLALPLLATVAAAAVVTIRVDGNRDLAGAVVVQIKALGETYASIVPGASNTVSLGQGSYELWSDDGPDGSESTPVPLNVTVIVSHVSGVLACPQVQPVRLVDPARGVCRTRRACASCIRRFQSTRVAR